MQENAAVDTNMTTSSRSARGNVILNVQITQINAVVKMVTMQFTFVSAANFLINDFVV